MFHLKSKKDDALHRLKIVRGHIDKVIKMVESDEYCVDILMQTKAVRSSLEKVDGVLLENHLAHCVVEHVQQGRTEQAIEEVMKIFNRSGSK
jgi:CsoR family transcriptional regulator, copper-sensing transcriptional repressor